MHPQQAPGPLFGWRVVLAATIGLAMSPGTVAFYSLGLFMRPINQELGWTRGQISFVATILTAGIIVMMPLIGRLIDKYGSRKVLTPSLGLLSLGLMSMLFVDSIWHFYAVFAFIGVAGAGANSPAYIRALSAWFDKRRGLVIGISSSGMGIGVMLIPGFVHFLTGVGGWRFAYAGIGLTVLLVGIPAVFFLLRDTPRETGYGPDGSLCRISDDSEAVERQGYPIEVCLRTRQFWKLLVLFTFVGGSLNAVAVHLAAMVEDQESARGIAVTAASVFGGAMTIGRLTTGYLMDRFFAPFVAAIFFFGATIGMSLLLASAPVYWLLLASLLIGLCAGAEGDVLGYLISRYFGLRSMGTIYGYIFSAYMVGASLCPFLMGLGHEWTGSYSLALVAAMSFILISLILVVRLGPYPTFPSLPSNA